MPAPKAINLTTQFEVMADFGVVEEAEAVNDGKGATGYFDDFVWVKFSVCLMFDSLG